MDDETTRHLSVLREVGLALLEGLKLTDHVMKNGDQLEESLRESLIGAGD